MLEVKIVANTPEEIQLLADLAADLAELRAGAEPKPRRGRPRKIVAPAPVEEPVVTATEEPTATTVQVKEPTAQATQEESPAVEPTLEDVQKALQRYAEQHGAMAIVDILKQQGVRRVPELKPEHYEAVLAAADLPPAKKAA